MASEIALTIWTDAAADPSVAHSLAVEAAAGIRRSTGLAAEVAGFSARAVEPRDVTEAVEADWTPAEVVSKDEYDAVAQAYETALAELAAATDALAEAEAAAHVAPEAEVAEEPKPARKPRAKKAATVEANADGGNIEA